MYYDCLQCTTEHCRHLNAVSMIHSNVKNYTSPNNNNYNSVNNRGLSTTTINSRFVLTNYQYSYEKTKSFYPGRDDTIREKRMIIRRGKSKSPIPITPARKRSSLARPVRVHDSSVHPNISSKLSDFSVDEHYVEQTNPGETAYYTGGLPFDDHSGSESGWPIRLRLEEMLELTLSRSKRTKRMKTRKRKKVTLTSKHGHFKDTERLLKVLSINNVDQDCSYNIKRCSIM